MPIHFSPAEMTARKQRLRQALAAQGLDGILLFAQESQYWLTGYDTFGFCFFQCLYFGADGKLALLTRSADLRQAQRTSDIKDIRVWKDGQDATRPWTCAGCSRISACAGGSASSTIPAA
jgi:Xaa-Pro dipeptidase